MSHTQVYTAISSGGPRLAGISLGTTAGKAFFHDCAHTAGLSWSLREDRTKEGRKELPNIGTIFSNFRSQRKETSRTAAAAAAASASVATDSRKRFMGTWSVGVGGGYL